MGSKTNWGKYVCLVHMQLNCNGVRKGDILPWSKGMQCVCRMFWEVVLGMPQDLQKKVLFFTTGSDRIPIGGMGEMQFKITKVDNIDM